MSKLGISLGNFLLLVFSLDTLILYHHTFQTVIQNKSWSVSHSKLENTFSSFLFKFPYDQVKVTKSHFSNLLHYNRSRSPNHAYVCKDQQTLCTAWKMLHPKPGQYQFLVLGIVFAAGREQDSYLTWICCRIITPMITSIRATIIPSQLIQTHKKVQRNAIYLDKHAHFGGNPFYQATKWHLTTVKWWTMRCRTKTLICFG